jgi:hypothetical protein
MSKDWRNGLPVLETNDWIHFQDMDRKISWESFHAKRPTRAARWQLLERPSKTWAVKIYLRGRCHGAWMTIEQLEASLARINNPQIPIDNPNSQS